MTPSVRCTVHRANYVLQGARSNLRGGTYTVQSTRRYLCVASAAEVVGLDRALGTAAVTVDGVAVVAGELRRQSVALAASLYAFFVAYDKLAWFALAGDAFALYEDLLIIACDAGASCCEHGVVTAVEAVIVKWALASLAR